MKQKFIIFILCIIGCAGLVFFLLPGPTSCLLMTMKNLDVVSHNVFSYQESLTQKSKYLSLIDNARTRIKNMYGSIQSDPIVIFFDQLDPITSRMVNSYGSTNFIGNWMCIMVGPSGQNIDVVAHELMHAETHYRLGSLYSFFYLPSWFDEGISMQVDYRPQYELSGVSLQDIEYIRGLTSSNFYKGDSHTLTKNYASAKALVGIFLTKIGHKNIYVEFQKMKNEGSDYQFQ